MTITSCGMSGCWGSWVIPVEARFRDDLAGTELLRHLGLLNPKLI